MRNLKPAPVCRLGAFIGWWIALLGILIGASCSSDAGVVDDATDACIRNHADGTMLSDDPSCLPPGACGLVDREAQTREACRASGYAGCDFPFITREAAMCAAFAAGLEPGEVATLARLGSGGGPNWQIRAVRWTHGDYQFGGESWRLSAIDADIVHQSFFEHYADIGDFPDSGAP